MATNSDKTQRPLRNRIISVFLSILLWLTRSSSKKSGQQTSAKGKSLLLTATFYSENWILSQLLPLSRAPGGHSVTFVSARKIPPIEGIEVVYPPVWMKKAFGGVPSRLLVFFWLGIRRRPDIVGGFHLLINGLVALLIARITRGSSLYICVGGPTEVLGGGYATENRIFGKLNGADQKIEHQLIQAVGRFDNIVVRGTSGQEFFASRDVEVPIYRITAGIDSDAFRPLGLEKDVDIVFLARLSDVKRLGVFLGVVAVIQQKYFADVRALVVGDGPNRLAGENIARETGIEDNVTWMGQRDDIPAQLNRSKVFVLTSRSEGLSQAMIQAMLCGLPAVVADVGSLSDLVDDDCGSLVSDHSNPSSYAKAIVGFLEDQERLQLAGRAARASALRCSLQNVADKWGDLLVEFDT